MSPTWPSEYESVMMLGNEPRTPRARRGEVLVAILNRTKDYAILMEQSWYRVPTTQKFKTWPPKWLALYQTNVFGRQAYAINYYGRVSDVRIATRRKLIPDENRHPHADNTYYQLILDRIEQLEQPIPSTRFRRIVFIPTTWHRFTHAADVNDPFCGSPLEERLWREFKRLALGAERELFVRFDGATYNLDFALFCAKGNIDIETDGDSYHANPERAARDNVRNSALECEGWSVLRFGSQQIREQMLEYCIPSVIKTVSRLGGLKRSTRDILPRRAAKRVRAERALFEERVQYNWD